MRVFTIYFAVVLLFSCKVPATEPNNNTGKVRVVNGVTFAEDNVSVDYGSKPFALNKYYTSTDTLDLNDPVVFSKSFCALLDESDSLRVSWQLAGKSIPDYQQKKVWVQEEKKWMKCNYGAYTLNREPARVTLKSTFHFIKSNKVAVCEVSYEVTSKDYYYDLYEVNFGMSRAQVKANEVARIPNFPTAWLEPTPSTAISDFNTNISVLDGCITYYEFENDKLKRVSDVILDLQYFANLQSLAKRYNVPMKPTLKSSFVGNERVYELTNEQSWNNGKIKFILSKKEIQLSSNEKKKLFAITYEQL
jgi:hypothetical protein